MTDYIHHYCSANVFFKIISGKAVWLTALNLSNDSKEGWYIIEHWLERFATKTAEDIRKKFGYSTAVRQMMDHAFAFGTCFSEDGDLLSQWRGYADDGSGFSIAFDRERLESFLRNHEIDLALRKVSYFGADYKEIKSLFKKMHALWEDDVRTAEITPGSTASMNFDFSSGDKRKKQSEILQDVFSFKMNSFSEEKEWRLFKVDHLSSFLDVSYTERRGQIVPYIELTIPMDVIRSVTTGPTNTTHIKVLEEFLKCNDAEHVGVHRSRAPYRSK